MNGFSMALLIVVLFLGYVSGADVFAPDSESYTVLLNGDKWTFAPNGQDPAENVYVPNTWGSMPQAGKGHSVVSEWKYAVYSREFELENMPPHAALEVRAMRWGGEVSVNGTVAGTHDLGHSKAMFNVSEYLQPGTNVLEIKTFGWNMIPTHGKDKMIPIGAAWWWGAKDGGILDDIILHVYNGALIETVRIETEADGPALSGSVRLSTQEDAWEGTVACQVISRDGATAVTPVIRKPVIIRNGRPTTVEIDPLTVPGAALWSPESPMLYRLSVWLEAEGVKEPASVREEVFGFRTVARANGRLHINGKPLALFGATQYGNGLNWPDNPERRKAFQVTMFKEMNGKVFRSHMSALTREWLEMCDEGGVLVVCEFPNFPDCQVKGDRNPYRIGNFWENYQREMQALIETRINHPSIIAWSVSNEGNGYGDWERGNLLPFAEALDPTRLIMFSADITNDFADSHNFAGLWWGTYKDFERAAGLHAEFYKDRIVGNTEFGQYEGGPKWYGPEKVGVKSLRYQRDHARILMEQVEAMRRLRFGMIMPYAYGGWWLGQAMKTMDTADANQQYFALRHAFAPVGVSIDLENRHALTGAQIDIPVWVMSDAADGQGNVAVKLYLLQEHPGFEWDGSDLKSVAPDYEVTKMMQPWSTQQHTFTLTLPAAAGNYTLAAVVTGEAVEEPSVSFRPLRLYTRPAIPEKKLKVGLISRDTVLRDWLTARGHTIVLPYGHSIPDAIIVDEGRIYDSLLRQNGFAMATKISEGGTRLIVLEQPHISSKSGQGNMQEVLIGLETEPMTVPWPCLFPEAELKESVGTAADFKRLNGLEGVGFRARYRVNTEILATETGPLAPETVAGMNNQENIKVVNPWKRLISGYTGPEPFGIVMGRNLGKGTVIVSQMPLKSRINPDDTAGYDPVAERLLAYLVEGKLSLK